MYQLYEYILLTGDGEMFLHLGGGYCPHRLLARVCMNIYTMFILWTCVISIHYERIILSYQCNFAPICDCILCQQNMPTLYSILFERINKKARE